MFWKIQSQTQYEFLFDDEDLKPFQNLNVSEEGEIQEVLTAILKGKGLTFEKKANVFVIKKEAKKADKQEENKLLRGVVKDDEGNTLPGATVRVKKTKRGVVADINGNYEIELPGNDYTLVFSFIGFETREEFVGDRTTIDITLQSENVEMNEVIAVGYGSIRRKDMTGSVSRVGQKIIQESAYRNISQVLQGQASGVEVIRGGGPNGQTKIKIRGDATLMGVDPLIVVDDFPMPEGYDIDQINVNSINTVDILKGASATAIYGSKAAGGVLIITTKIGSGGKPKLNIKYDYGFTSLVAPVNVLNADELKYLYYETLADAALKEQMSIKDLLGERDYNNRMGPGFWGDSQTDWADVASQKARSHNLYLSINGGGKASKYYTTFGLKNDQGAFMGSDNIRLNGSIKQNTKLTKWLESNIAVRINKSTSHSGGSFSSVYKARPDWEPYNENGSVNLPTFTNDVEDVVYYDTPLTDIYGSANENRSFDINLSSELKFKISKDLNFKTSYSYRLGMGRSRNYSNKTLTRSGRTNDGYLSVGNSESKNVNVQNILSYTKQVEDHRVTLMMGQSYRHQERYRESFTRKGFATDVQSAPWQGIEDASEQDFSGGQSASNIMSLFSRFNYKYKNYLLTATIRRDASSRFSEKNNAAYFPSVAVGWVLSDYDFWKRNMPFINEFKLRSSIGKSGNDMVGEFAWRNTYITRTYNDESSTYIYRMGNDQLKWETVDQFDIALDFAFFKNRRISGTLNYYTKKTKDILFRQSLPPSVGIRRDVNINLANVDNEGIEIDLKYDIIKKADLNWNLALNISRNTNMVTNINRDVSNIDNDSKLDYIVREGEPLGRFFGFVTDGIIKTQEEVDAYQSLNNGDYLSGWGIGDYKIVDRDGDGIITTEDKTVLGNSNPDFHGGIRTSVTYKGLSFSMHSKFSVGGERYWRAVQNQFVMDRDPTNRMSFVFDRWSPDNPDSEWPSMRFGSGGNYIIKNALKDVYIYDASYFKITSLSVAYQVPNNLLMHTPFINALKFSFNVNNVYTFTNYPGANVESYPSDAIQGISVDYSAYPRERTYLFGCSLSF